MMHKVLVTGGFGYLGGRLAQFLDSQGGYEILLGSRWRPKLPDRLLKGKTVQTVWDSPKDRNHEKVNFPLRFLCKLVKM